MMNKLIRAGQVAVLVSPGFGAGWYSWHHVEELIYDPSVVEWLEQGEMSKIEAYLALKYKDEYFGGLEDLVVMWVPKGARFRIEEYDGAESLVLESEERWMTA
jgi:hypothetical protein